MELLSYLKMVERKMTNQDAESLKMSLDNVHHKGLFSMVISGTEPGKLLRVFIANEDIEPFKVQLHSHRYAINLTTIKGQIMHHTIDDDFNGNDGVRLSRFEYKSPLNGGDGLRYLKENQYKLRSNYLPIGSQLYMNENDIHTVSCKKGAMWIVEELGFRRESSVVLGVPFVLDELYTKPEMFTINDNHQKVLRTIKGIIRDYELA